MSKETFSVRILGAFSANPPRGKHQTAQYLDAGEYAYLIDCGEGTQFRLGELELKSSKIKAVFISHLHGDHYLGLLGLLGSMSMNKRKDDLFIFAPKGMSEMLTIQMYFSGFVPEFYINFRELTSETQTLIYDDKRVEVWAFPLQHRIPCYGFVFSEKKMRRKIIPEKIPDGFPPSELNMLKNGENVLWNGINYLSEEMTVPPAEPRSYAFCTDTLYFPEMADYVKNCNLLYHDCTFSSKHRQRAIETFHSTSEEAATTALRAGVNQLLIGHFSSRYQNQDELLAEAKSVFENTLIAREGEIFEIN